MKVGDPSRKRDEPKRRCMKIIQKNLEKKNTTYLRIWLKII